jgi:hypothetical protein
VDVSDPTGFGTPRLFAKPGVQCCIAAVELVTLMLVAEPCRLKHPAGSAAGENCGFACSGHHAGCVICGVERRHQRVELLGLHHRHRLVAQLFLGSLQCRFSHEFRGLFVDRTGGLLNAIQSRLLCANLNTLRLHHQRSDSARTGPNFPE